MRSDRRAHRLDGSDGAARLEQTEGYLQIYDRAYFACHAAAGRLYVLHLPSCWNRTSGGQAFPPLPHFTCMT